MPGGITVGDDGGIVFQSAWMRDETLRGAQNRSLRLLPYSFRVSPAAMDHLTAAHVCVCLVISSFHALLSLSVWCYLLEPPGFFYTLLFFGF